MKDTWKDYENMKKLTRSYEEIAKKILDYAQYEESGALVSDKKEEARRIEKFRPVADVIFDMVTDIPQYNQYSSLARLGLKTGHLVTENPIEGWRDDILDPKSEPTKIYLYNDPTAPEWLIKDSKMPEYLRNKREVALAMNALKDENVDVEGLARKILDYAQYEESGALVSDKKEVARRIEKFRPVADVIFDMVTDVPQYNQYSSLARLGLETGHLVTENPIEGWRDDILDPKSEPTKIYLYNDPTAPEWLIKDSKMPEYLRNKREVALANNNVQKLKKAN